MTEEQTVSEYQAMEMWDATALKGTPDHRVARETAEALRSLLDRRNEWEILPHEAVCRCGATANGDCRVTDDWLRGELGKVRAELAATVHQRDRLRGLIGRMRQLGHHT